MRPVAGLRAPPAAGSPVRLEFVVRPPLGAGPSPGSGRPNGHCSARHGPPCVRRQREMVEEPQGQGGLDGEIRVPPLPALPAAPAGRPGSDRFRGQPHRHIAASNEGLVVGQPVRHAVLRLIRGMDLRLHPCCVAPAEGHEKCRPNRPTRRGSSCNNASKGRQNLNSRLTFTMNARLPRAG